MKAQHLGNLECIYRHLMGKKGGQKLNLYIIIVTHSACKSVRDAVGKACCCYPFKIRASNVLKSLTETDLTDFDNQMRTHDQSDTHGSSSDWVSILRG